MEARRARMLFGIDVAQLSGLEIGALNRPIVRRSDGQVLYVDYTDKESLKASIPPGTNAEDLVEVDLIWGATPLNSLIHEPVDYIVASHVIEHVPDFVGWLLELHSVVKKGGLISLAIPDRRFTFDFKRPESTLGDAIEAYLTQPKTPSVRHVFDNCALAVHLDHREAWRRDFSNQDLPPLMGKDGLQLAYDQCVQLTKSNRYIDSHCWVFTPNSFLDISRSLNSLGLFPFILTGFQPTPFDDIEFTVHLKATTLSDSLAIRTAIDDAQRSLIEADPLASEDAPQSVKPATELRAIVRAILRRFNLNRSA